MQLDKAITSLQRLSGESRCSRIDIRAQLIVAVVYIVAVVSVPILNTGMLIWLLIYPIIMSEAMGIGYGRILGRSLWILPLVVIVGIFNPWLDHRPMWVIGGVSISRGWVSFITLTIRGVLSFQALLILVDCCGFDGMCRAMGRLGLPSILVSQLQMTNRFIIVVMNEALVMHRSRQARGFGRKSYPLSMWGTFIGQLLMRSIRRAGRVNRAMEARGYTGTLPSANKHERMRGSDWAYIAAWICVFAAIRLTPVCTIFDKFINF